MLTIKTSELKENLWMTKFAEIPFSDGPHNLKSKFSASVSDIKRKDTPISKNEFKIKFEDLTNHELKAKRIYFEVIIHSNLLQGDATAFFRLPPEADSHIQKILTNRKQAENNAPDVNYSDKLLSELPEAMTNTDDLKIQTSPKNTKQFRQKPIKNNGFIGRISNLLRNLAAPFISIFKYFKSLLGF